MELGGFINLHPIADPERVERVNPLLAAAHSLAQEGWRLLGLLARSEVGLCPN
jgi:hypothetical protein